MTIRPTPTAAASPSRIQEDDRTPPGNPVATPTTAVTIVSCARMLLKKRWLQTVQYGSPRNHVTAAASRKPEIAVAATTPRKKTDRRRGVSKRGGASLSNQTVPADNTASVQLVRKRASTIVGGQPVGSSTATWTGNTGSRTSHQRRGGTRRSAAVMMAFGGQRTDGVAGGTRRSSPRMLPK